MKRWLRARARLPLPWPYFTVLAAIATGLLLLYSLGGGDISSIAKPTVHDGGDAARMSE